MTRSAPALIILLAAIIACDRDPDQPVGNAWEPCNTDRRCSGDDMICQQAWGASDVTYCAPTCAWGGSCGAPPLNDDGIAVVGRCTATEDSPAGLCIVDCSTADNCPAGMLCFFDETYTLSTNLGVCAWPPV